MTRVISRGLTVSRQLMDKCMITLLKRASPDASKFGTSYLSKFGWDPSKGLGAAGDGRTSHIKVSQKLNMLGIGSGQTNDPNAIAWKQNKDFEALLKRLNEGKEESQTKPEIKQADEPEGSVDEDQTKDKKRKRKDRVRDEEDTKKKNHKRRKSSPPAEAVVEQVTLVQESSTVEVVKVSASRPMAHRARHRASKNISSKSAAAIAEILGIAPTPSGSQTPQLSGTLTQIHDEPTLEKLTVSTRSMADYFKDRLKAKSGDASPATPADSPGTPAENDAYDAPRGGLGASRGIGMKSAHEDAPATGLGMSKFGSLMSGTFLASLGGGTGTTGADKGGTDEAEKPSTEDADEPHAGAEGDAERKARRKAEKRAKREAKEASQPIAEELGDTEPGAKAAKKAAKKAKEQSTSTEDEGALAKAQRKAEKRARKAKEREVEK
ncbi:hypothetical protein HWV62_36418 [Athelia sp. TMB]|nr:hypothetical protein HWV62_36418 [Athelia sp. TMB]